MNARVSERIEEFLQMHRTQGTGKFLQITINFLRETLKKYPSKPSPSDIEARLQVEVIDQSVHGVDAKGIRVNDRFAKDWDGSEYCRICLADIINDFRNYLDPNCLICFNAKNIEKLIKHFEANCDYMPQKCYYTKYRLEGDKFVVEIEKYQFAKFDVTYGVPKNITQPKVPDKKDRNLLTSAFLHHNEDN